MEPLRKLFIDIETHYVIDLEDQDQLIYDAFMGHNYDPKSLKTPNEQFRECAGLIPEFGQIICISLGYEDLKTGDWRCTSLAGTDEKKILEDLSSMCYKFYAAKYNFVGYNSNQFDIPFIGKRMVKHHMKLPPMINNYGLKPWELANQDVMNDWKMGGWNASSLQTVSAMLGVKSKSEEVSGQTMYTIPIEEMDWDELKKYCEEDVFVTYQIFKRLVESVY